MAITTEQSNRMIVEATAGLEKTSIPGEEAATYYKALRAEVQEMMLQGYMPLCNDD